MYQKYIKRLFDLSFALVLLPIFLILFIFISIAIKLDDRGPVFYNGERLGKDGKVFKMLKFRSMKVDAPDWRLEDGSTFNAEDDPRQTRIGKILRKTSMDELPQIVNILIGQMSFIGPRPDPVDWLEKYSLTDRKLLSVLPGVTGYNQAYFRNSTDGREKTDNDVYYAENISLKLDIEILLVTLVSVFRRENIYKV